MKYKFFSFNLDFVGFSASLLCAIHCASLPFLMTMSALGGIEFLEDPRLEWGMILLSFVIASSSLFNGYRNQHGKFQAIKVVVLGFGLIAASRLVEDPSLEPVFMTLGGISVAVAHWINWKLGKHSEACKINQVS